MAVIVREKTRGAMSGRRRPAGFIAVGAAVAAGAFPGKGPGRDGGPGGDETCWTSSPGHRPPRLLSHNDRHGLAHTVPWTRKGEIPCGSSRSGGAFAAAGRGDVRTFQGD